MEEHSEDIRIKICGLTNEADLRWTQELGAEYAGFVFYPRSPRFIAPRRAREVIRRTRADGAKRTSFVGVFVDDDIRKVRRIYAECGLDIVQLHGHETLSYCRELGLPCWKAVRLKDETSLRELAAFPGLTLLVDAHVEGSFGGSGRRLPLDLVRIALAGGQPIVVAGGVSAASLPGIWPLHPFAVDASSSLEERPGKKSEHKMREFFEKIRQLRGRT